MGKRSRTDPTPRRERQVRGPSVYVSVGQRLIELKFRNGFRIGGVEPAGLIELEDALGQGPSGRQWRGHANHAPIVLQDHGNPVSYCNVWVRTLPGG